jgi:ribose-phosphate pyrophosphokinase
VVKGQEKVFRSIYTDWREVFIVAPDAGAYKKSYKFAQSVGAAGVITCNKIRDLKSGKIEGISCEQNVTGKHLLVLDDICDGGRTFIEVANIMDKASRVDLAVTHGIFSKGVEVVASKFDNVYTTNSFHGVVPENLKADNVKWMEVV